MASELNVTFINPGGQDGFWGAVSKTMRAAADDFDINLEIIDSNRDRFSMVKAAKTVSSKSVKPDYVILVNELDRGLGMAKTLTDAGIPSFFLLNRLAQDQIDKSQGLNLAGSVVPDNEIAGYEMAISLIEATRTAGKADDGIEIMALLGDKATPAALQREKGLRRAVAEHSDATIVRDFAVNWSADEAKEKTGLFLRRGSVDAIWAANDPISLGAQEAAVDAGFVPGKDIFFVGLNWSTPALVAVDGGTMTLTHGGHFFGGAWAIVLLNDMVSGHATPGGNYEFPMSAVTSQNVSAFLSSLATGDYDAIDFTLFSAASDTRDGYSFTADAILSATAE